MHCSIDFCHIGLEVDAGFEYGIWVSFAEIYNEKVYDLLESPSKKQTKRPSLPLKYEYRSGYKYVAGLKNVRVKTAKVHTLANDEMANTTHLFGLSLGSLHRNTEGATKPGGLLNFNESIQQPEPQHLHHQSHTLPSRFRRLCYRGKGHQQGGGRLIGSALNKTSILGLCICHHV